MEQLWERQIAGPLSGLKRNGQYPALAAVGSKSDILGPGRLHNVKELLFTVDWQLSTTGEITVYGSDDPSDQSAGAPLVVIPWHAGGTRIDQWRYSGSHQALWAEVTTTAVDGNGATITASGNM